MTKRFRGRVAVDDVSFDVRPGAVTAFLGPNGAGKTTTIRAILGLLPVDEGEVAVLGRPFRTMTRPAGHVGAVLDRAGFHPRRTGRDHLRVLAALGSVEPARVGDVLDEMQLDDAADRPVATYSHGMRSRLALASALLGRPEVLVLDEPSNGLDPAGIRWLRDRLRAFAAAGGTVFVSSHVLAEVVSTADDVIVVHRGRVVAETTVDEVTGSSTVLVRTRAPAKLAAALEASGATVRRVDRDGLEVAGLAQERVGAVAAAGGIVLHELRGLRRSLEDVFLELTT